MPSMQLEYNLTRPFPWRSYTWVTMSLFACLFVGLTVLNVALVGYDLVSVSTTEFNTTSREWWRGISALKKQQASCQPKSFSVGDTWRTTTGALDYTIDAISKDGGIALPSLPSFQYSNSPLSVCDVANMSLSSTGLIYQSSWTATVICPPPLGIRATTSWTHGSPNVDTYVKFLGTIGSLTPSGDALTAIRASHAVAIHDVMGAVNDDFIGENHADESSAFLFNFLAQPSCTGALCTSADNEAPTVVEKTPNYNWNRIGFDGAFQAVSTPEWGFSANATAMNAFQVLLSAVRLDLGHLGPNNIFTNFSALNLTLRDTADNTYTSRLRSDGTGYNSLAQLPLVLSTTESPVISTAYLCTHARIKNAASLISSVFASTMSMLLVLWALWSLAAAWLAKRHDEEAFEKDRLRDREGYTYRNPPIPLEQLDRASPDFNSLNSRYSDIK